jgi:hypothetical protein
MFLKFVKFDTSMETPHVDYTAETCLNLAKSRGADAFSWAGPGDRRFPDSKNACMGYWHIPIGGDITETGLGGLVEEDQGIVSGCVDQTKSWPNCGTTTSWCHRTYEGDSVLPTPDVQVIPRYMSSEITNNDIFTRKTLKDIKTAWDTPGYLKINGQTEDIKTQGYKYAAITISDATQGSPSDAGYYVNISWGKELPGGAPYVMDIGGVPDAECSYGGKPDSATQYTVGRKEKSYIFTSNPKLNLPGDTWTRSTAKIYDISQVE